MPDDASRNQRQPRTPRSFYGLVMLIVAAAFAVRLLYLTQIENIPFFHHLIGDGKRYWEWAGRIAGGDWLGNATFYQAPAYPYFLALVRLVVGDNLWLAHVAQAALGSIACGLLALAGRAFISPRAGLCTGVIVALYGPAIFFDGLIQKATLSLFLMSALLCLLGWIAWNWERRTLMESVAHARDERSRGLKLASLLGPQVLMFFACGVVLGLLALTREQALLLGVVVLVWLVVRGVRFAVHSGDVRPQLLKGTGHSRWVACPRPPEAGAGMLKATKNERFCIAALRLAMPPGFFVLGIALVLGPVAWRNYRVGGELALTTVQAGPNFYIGNHDGATGRYIALKPGAEWPPLEQRAATELAEAETGRSLAPREVSHYWLGKSWDYIKHQPLDWLGLLLHKWALVWNAYELSDTESYTLYAHLSWLLGVCGKLNHFGVLWPLAAVGLAATARRWRSLWLLYALILAVAGGVAVFYVFARYRYPLVPLLAIFAGAGVVEIVRIIRKRGRVSFPRSGIIVGIVIIVAVTTNLRFEHQRLLDGTAYHNWGEVMRQDGNYTAAAYLLEEALRYQPESPAVHTSLGATLAAQGRALEAADHYAQALDLDPNFARAHFRLGLLYVAQGRFDDALRSYREVVRTDPSNAAVHYNIGALLDHQGRSAAAANEYRLALKLDPHHAKARAALEQKK